MNGLKVSIIHRYHSTVLRDIKDIQLINIYSEMGQVGHLLHDKLGFINDEIDLLSCVPG